MSSDFIQARSASGRPLCFPLRQQIKKATATEEAPEELTQLETQLQQPAEMEAPYSTRFSTAIYQILERVENKVPPYGMMSFYFYFTFLDFR